MLREFTEKILRDEDLSFDDAQAALNGILDGNCNEVEIAGFLTALAAKGETAAEVAGMARSLRDHAVPVRPKTGPLVDVVGTGGDGQSTFNISTTAALVAAGAGVKIAKHGNRAITSKCGSADVLAELGVKIDAAPEVIEKCIDEANIGFMFAPCHHPTMKYVQPIRKALGFRTVFNVLGPLANPAQAPLMIVGVAKAYLLDIMADALNLLGVERVMVVHGEGMDEFTTCGPTDIAEVRNGKISRHTIDYSDYGLAKASLDDLAGGSLEKNLQITRGIVENQISGPCRDIVEFNAAAAIMVSGQAPGFFEAIEMANEAISSGAVKNTLKKFVEISNS
ncbi:MAG: anthranilate phosphoribosyltransferase [Sedimentisphaerales bacterium]|nr:anthranilate phosphoribosyltransferase [Sedimentisphaerales bacterium]